MLIVDDIGQTIIKYIPQKNIYKKIYNMTLRPVKDITEYKRVKEALRERFEAERAGDQDLFKEQSKIFQPLIDTQQQTAKAIKDVQNINATAVSNALLPLTKEL